MAQNHCTHCGSLLPENVAFCPSCGHDVSYNAPAGQQPVQPQQPRYQQPRYQPYPQDNGNSKAILYAIIAVLLVLIIGGVAYWYISNENKKQEQVEQLQQQLEEQQKEMQEQKKDIEEKNEQLQKETAEAKEAAKNAKVIVKESVPSHRAVSAGGGAPKVVINGQGVRLRFGPGLSYGYLTWSNGQTRAPAKGARLEYTGDAGEWYQVRYLGHTFYVSKEFSYLEY